MSNTLIDCACGANDVPDWNGKGQCITCARDAVLGEPQATTLDEIEPILRFMIEKLVFDNSIAGKVPIAEAKQQIQALIAEARIDELLTYKSNLPDVDSTEVWLNTRLQQLKEKL